ncbi:unnamed protein product [Owenia fusiformis]|uniref:Uncharacterized protein n=1 Tax=Owenia fusiformis TaxID=6347 RepID=A0A8S4P9E9_OWEFU|nr:unnamed protein product [Owenia fusiformis]
MSESLNPFQDNDKDVTKDPTQDDAMDFEDSNDAGMADTVTDIISSLEDKNNEMEPHAINEKEETYINKIADNAASRIPEAEKGAIDNATESTDPTIDETVSEKGTIDIAIEPTEPIIGETLSEKQPEEIMDDNELSMKEHSNEKKATEDPSPTEELEDITKTSFENTEASSICNTIEENTNKPSDEQIYSVPSDELGVNALDDDTSDRNGSPNVGGSMEDENDTPMFDLDNVDVIPTQIEDNKQTVDDSAEEKVLEMPKEIEADQIKDTIETNEKEDNSVNNQDIPDENASEQVQATEGEKQEKNTEQQDNMDNRDNIKADEQDNVDNNEPGNVTNNQQDSIETNDSKEKTAIDNSNTNVDNGTDDLSQVDTHQSTNVPGIVGASELSTPNSLLQPDINIPFEDKHLNSPGTPVMDEPEDAEPIEDQITDTSNTLEQVTQLEPEDILEHDTPKGKETGSELEKEPDARKKP